MRITWTSTFLFAGIYLTGWLTYQFGYMNGAETEIDAANMKLRNCHTLITRNYR
jgi:hypothetical protein